MNPLDSVAALDRVFSDFGVFACGMFIGALVATLAFWFGFFVRGRLL